MLGLRSIETPAASGKEFLWYQTRHSEPKPSELGRPGRCRWHSFGGGDRRSSRLRGPVKAETETPITASRHILFSPPTSRLPSRARALPDPGKRVANDKGEGPGGRGPMGGRACAQRGRGRPGGEKEEGLRPRKAGVGARPGVPGSAVT